jgi:hypothetical protein
MKLGRGARQGEAVNQDQVIMMFDPHPQVISVPGINEYSHDDRDIGQIVIDVLDPNHAEGVRRASSTWHLSAVSPWAFTSRLSCHYQLDERKQEDHISFARRAMCLVREPLSYHSRPSTASSKASITELYRETGR